MSESSNIRTSPALVIVCFLDYRHPSGYEVVLYVNIFKSVQIRIQASVPLRWDKI